MIAPPRSYHPENQHGTNKIGVDDFANCSTMKTIICMAVFEHVGTNQTNLMVHPCFPSENEHVIT